MVQRGRWLRAHALPPLYYRCAMQYTTQFGVYGVKRSGSSAVLLTGPHSRTHEITAKKLYIYRDNVFNELNEWTERK